MGTHRKGKIMFCINHRGFLVRLGGAGISIDRFVYTDRGGNIIPFGTIKRIVEKFYNTPDVTQIVLRDYLWLACGIDMSLSQKEEN
jgi:hypothetical protein